MNEVRTGSTRGLCRTAAAGILALLAFTIGAQETTPAVYRLRVDGLACPFCAYGIEKQLSTIEGVSGLDTDIETGMVTLTMVEGATLDEDTARKAVDAAGFTLRGFERLEASP